MLRSASLGLRAFVMRIYMVNRVIGANHWAMSRTPTTSQFGGIRWGSGAAIPRVGAPLGGVELGNELISRRAELIFACKREKNPLGFYSYLFFFFFVLEGCFRVFGCVFAFWGGVFRVLWGGGGSRCVAIYFARSAKIYLVLFYFFSYWS